MNDTPHASDPVTELEQLARDVYGEDLEAFMSTPRSRLGGRTPREAIEAGEIDAVRDILLRALDGSWT